MSRQYWTRTGAVVLLLMAATVGRAGQEGADRRWSDEGRKHILEVTRWLEEHPLEDADKLKRTEVLTWWTEVPGVTLAWCSGLLIDGKNEKAASMLVTQGMFGAGAHLIEHPDAEAHAIAMAGIGSALSAYRHAVVVDASYRDPLYDALAGDPRKASAYADKKLAECAKAEAKKK